MSTLNDNQTLYDFLKQVQNRQDFLNNVENAVSNQISSNTNMLKGHIQKADKENDTFSNQLSADENLIKKYVRDNDSSFAQLSPGSDLNSISNGSYMIDLQGHNNIKNLPNNDNWFYGRIKQYTTHSGLICQDIWYDNNEYGNCVYNRVHDGHGWHNWKASVAESESYKGELPNSDLNEMTTPGIYHIDGIKCQNSPDNKLNYPYSDWGMLKVLNVNTNGLGQLYYTSYGTNSMTIAFRIMGHGKWLPWNIVANDTDIQNLQQQKANKSDLRALSNTLDTNIKQINNTLNNIQNNLNKLNSKVNLH